LEGIDAIKAEILKRLNPDNKLSEIEVAVHQKLLITYPKEPT